MCHLQWNLLEHKQKQGCIEIKINIKHINKHAHTHTHRCFQSLILIFVVMTMTCRSKLLHQCGCCYSFLNTALDMYSLKSLLSSFLFLYHVFAFSHSQQQDKGGATGGCGIPPPLSFLCYYRCSMQNLYSCYTVSLTSQSWNWERRNKFNVVVTSRLLVDYGSLH